MKISRHSSYQDTGVCVPAPEPGPILVPRSQAAGCGGREVADLRRLGQKRPRCFCLVLLGCSPWEACSCHRGEVGLLGPPGWRRHGWASGQPQLRSPSAASVGRQPCVWAAFDVQLIRALGWRQLWLTSENNHWRDPSRDCSSISKSNSQNHEQNNRVVLNPQIQGQIRYTLRIITVENPWLFPLFLKGAAEPSVMFRPSPQKDRQVPHWSATALVRK